MLAKRQKHINMKHLFITSIILLGLRIFVFAQPTIMWQNCIGGSESEGFQSIEVTEDNQLLFVGSTYSNDGDVSGNHGRSDIWAGKLDHNGILLWNKCYGGSRWEYGDAMDYTSDGGMIIAGQTDSNDGDISGFIGYVDYWVVKTDSSGNIEWEKCYGGTYVDKAYAVKQTPDNGFIIAGKTNSNDGDVSGNHGNDDCWIVKTDSLGNIEWQKCLGGSDNDYANDICIVNDGYIVLICSESDDGDVTGNHGNDDYWIVKLDNLGNIIWQKCLGGSSADWGKSISATTDNGCIAIGVTFSNDGDISNNTGETDYWVVKLDEFGNLEWEKCYGFGSDNSIDHGHDIYKTLEGGYIIGGYSFDYSTCYDEWDYWIIKIDSIGIIEWEKCLGGTAKDFLYSVLQDMNGDFIAAGNTRSNDGDVSGNHGVADSWIVKLGNPNNVFEMKRKPNIDYLLYPNPSNSTITIELGNIEKHPFDLKIYNIRGELVKVVKNNIGTSIEFGIEELKKGLYLFQIDKSQIITGKFIVD